MASRNLGSPRRRRRAWLSNQTTLHDLAMDRWRLPPSPTMADVCRQVATALDQCAAFAYAEIAKYGVAGWRSRFVSQVLIALTLRKYFRASSPLRHLSGAAGVTTPRLGGSLA